MNEVEAVKAAIANTTDFDGDRMASRYADSELHAVALAAIAALDAARGDAEPVAFDDEDGRDYVIRKNGYFYCPNAQGYTRAFEQAGRYTLDEAIKHSHPNGPDGPRDGIDYAHVSEFRDAHPPRGDQVARVVEFIREQQANADKHMREAAHRKTESHFAAAFVTLRNLADAIERGEPFNG